MATIYLFFLTNYKLFVQFPMEKRAVLRKWPTLGNKLINYKSRKDSILAYKQHSLPILSFLPPSQHSHNIYPFLSQPFHSYTYLGKHFLPKCHSSTINIHITNIHYTKSQSQYPERVPSHLLLLRLNALIRSWLSLPNSLLLLLPFLTNNRQNTANRR